jgi:hypothetical protein
MPIRKSRARFHRLRFSPGGWRGMVRHRDGFALIATMSMLVLLFLLAVGLLGLSSISLRSSSQADAQARARANARVALSLAIGQLQKHAGADTRVTARADILDESHPPVLGVWKSWEGKNHQLGGTFAGRPVTPGNYAARKQENFLAWLTSAEVLTGKGTEPPAATRSATSVTLVGPGSLGPEAPAGQLHLEPVPLASGGGNNPGSVAWWISGENQKARLPAGDSAADDRPAAWYARRQSNSGGDPVVFGLDELVEQPQRVNGAISLLQTDLLRGGGGSGGTRGSGAFLHDLTTCSVGLLTNTATGGWRKDMSLLTEYWAQVPSSNLPFFRTAPGVDLMSTKTAARSIFYPWSAYRGSTSNIPIYQHGAVASWENLKDYVTAYKRVAVSGGRHSMQPASVAIDGDVSSFLHKVRILPVIARVQWVYSHSAANIAGGIQPRLLVNPVVTLWNPYNVEIPTNSMELTLIFPRPLPTALRYTVNGVRDNNFRSLTTGSINYQALATSGTLNYRIPSGTAPLRPGETRVFSHQGSPVQADGGAQLPLSPGFSPSGGHFFVLKNSSGQNLVVPPTASISVEVALDTTYDDAGSVGVGVYLDLVRNGARHLVYRMVYTPQVARQVYRPITGLGAIASGELTSTAANPRPFLTTIFGARMASNTHLAAKGFVQSSPLVNYTAMGDKSRVESTISRVYGGTQHPVNSPFDFSFERLSAAGDALMPNVADGNQGYIVTGFTSGTGVTRCSVAEIPLRPPASLAELQHWDLRYENPIPPFAFNLIGNSDATPLLPSNAVVNATDASLNVNLQHDDSYCANHLLFDDWFLSTIAPTPNTFGAAGTNLQNTYLRFVNGEAPLANHAYRPIAEDAAAAAQGGAQALYTAHVNRPASSWRTIASRLEVEGMFNVNSTSVTAWRALLGHARNQKVPYVAAAGSGWQVATSDTLNHPVSRMNVAGDALAGEGSFVMDREIGGYQILDDEMIGKLAAEIVRQVRLRGPFLSLAEFVNRQLSSGELALAGAIQSALDQLSREPGSPWETVRDLSTESVAEPPGHPAQAYKFPEAAIGHGAYGVPGWIRQADVLRPIAPILSARDDTFTIRAYGDARDRNGAVLSRAVCEAVVRRTREYLEPSEAAELLTIPRDPLNRLFGRRFRVVSFRWLADSEI